MCASMMLVWLFSGWYNVRWDIRRFHSGGVSSLGLEISEGGLRLHRWADRQGMSGWLGFHGWRWGRIQDAPRWKVWFGYRDRWTSQILSAREWFCPLWAPLFLFGPPTVVLWRRVRVRPGCCPCGYPRAGLAESASCPECGRVMSPP